MNDAQESKPTEQQDAAMVDTAVEAIKAGDTTIPQKLLLDVIKRAPTQYTYSFTESDAVYYKFWDKSEFMHFFAQLKDQHAENRMLSGKTLYWLPSAYPRAYYYLGFLKVVAKQYEEAIPFLDRGLTLEPTNPKLRFEKATALTQLRRFAEALQLYESVNQVGFHVSAADVARALRGQGSVYLEMGNLDQAESLFKESLSFDPTNTVATDELLYMAQLRSGAETTTTELTTSVSDWASKCASCGKELTGEARVATKNGKSVFICESCDLTQIPSKKWWEVWK